MFTEEWLQKTNILGPTDEQTTRFLQKMHWFKITMLLYQSSLDFKNFMKLKQRQLFYIDIKLTEPFAVPKACTRWKTKGGIGIIFFPDDNYTDVMESSEWSTYVFRLQTQKQNFRAESSPTSFLPCIENILNNSSGKPVPRFPDSGCSEFH